MWAVGSLNVALCLLPVLAMAQTARPDPSVTPSAVNPDVTQATITDTICSRGWTRTIRPPRQYTSALKRHQLRAAGYSDQRMSDYEEDHLIPLELGGAPLDMRNLWPEPRDEVSGYAADQKDDLERALNRLVCDGRLPRVAAQAAIARDWPAAYERFIAPSR